MVASTTRNATTIEPGEWARSNPEEAPGLPRADVVDALGPVGREEDRGQGATITQGKTPVWKRLAVPTWKAISTTYA